MKPPTSATRHLLQAAALILVLLAMVKSSAQLPHQSNVRPSEAAAEARALAARLPGLQVFLASGDSMAPYYADGSIVLAQPALWAQLQPGMILLYRAADGAVVGHQLVRLEGDRGWTRGVNNPGLDPEPVTPANLQGVLVGVLHTAGPADTSATGTWPLVHGRRYPGR